MRLLFAVLFMLVVSTALLASDYPVGYTTPAGYTYGADGYWWYGNDAYTRIWVSGYYSCGCYYPGYYSYTYSHSKPRVSPTDPDWRQKLLEIAGERDRQEMKIRAAALEQQYFTEAVKALGLEGNFRIQNYGQAVVYPQGSYYNNFHLGTYGANGNTLYGYSYKSVADLYGQTDLNTLYQQASQLTQNAQSLAGQATTEFQGLAAKAGENQARVAEILARGEALRAMVRAIAPEPRATVTTQGQTFRVQSGAPAEQQATFAKLVADKCAACHSGDSAKGGFDVGRYASLPLDRKIAVWGRLVTNDPEKLMPRDAKGGPGQRLTPEELKLFFAN